MINHGVVVVYLQGRMEEQKYKKQSQIDGIMALMMINALSGFRTNTYVSKKKKDLEPIHAFP